MTTLTSKEKVLNSKVNDKVKKLYLSEFPDKIVMAEFTVEGTEYLEEQDKEIRRSDMDQRIKILNEIQLSIGIKPSKIQSYGIVESTAPAIFKRVCPKEQIRKGPSLKERNNIIPSNSYKCFVGFDDTQNKFNLIMHEDIHSSWRCAISKLGNPTHVIIYIE